MKRMSERGSVVGFVIVGILLAALAVGGVYALNKYNSSTSDDASNSQSTDEPSTPANETSDKTSDNSSTETTANNTQTSNETKTTPAVSQESSKLPQTGPVDTLITMLAGVLLAVGATAYVRSRRAIASL